MKKKKYMVILLIVVNDGDLTDVLDEFSITELTDAMKELVTFMPANN